MACRYCGKLCIDPHDVDAEPWECCQDGCGELAQYCQCHRCNCGALLKTPDEHADEVCDKCVKGGNK